MARSENGREGYRERPWSLATATHLAGCHRQEKERCPQTDRYEASISTWGLFFMEGRTETCMRLTHGVVIAVWHPQELLQTPVLPNSPVPLTLVTEGTLSPLSIHQDLSLQVQFERAT